MAVSSSTVVNMETGDASPPKSPSDARSISSASALFPCSPDASIPDCRDPSDSSPTYLQDAEIQSATQLRSEEYRQLFRLPPDEVLVEDFNCACQENILIQGHMYLFAHYICFYSNIFGFETKKIIHFRDITSVKRAKTAGIFPNAIEVFAGGKKHFFASFLSRDEAFRLIIDGWSQHGNGVEALIEKQDFSSAESSFRENGLEPGKLKISNCIKDLEISNRSEEDPSDDSEITPAPHNDNASTAVPGLQDDVYHDEEQVDLLESSPSVKAWTWKVEDFDAPKITEEYMKVAESKFPIKVEELFNLFFSDEDDAVGFIDSFHRKCGDKDFKCSSWSPHDQFGHVRNVSFQHPIKIYLGAKFGSCEEMQKFKVYKNSHLIVETSQEINDVPYGDYFRVEGMWDIKREDEGSCSLRVYINVAFSKKTMFKGKIVQSTLDECREVYAIFVNMAHDLLRERNIEKTKDNDASNPDSTSITSPNHGVHSERETNVRAPTQTNPHHATGNNQYDDSCPSPVNWKNCVSSNLPIKLRGSLVKFWSDIRTQTHSQPLIAISFLVILLMQLSIVLLLARPQNIQIISQREDYMRGGVEERASSPEMVSLLEKRIYNLKEEMSVVESWLERMRWEHARLMEQFRDLEQFHNPTKRTNEKHQTRSDNKPCTVTKM